MAFGAESRQDNGTPISLTTNRCDLPAKITII